LLLPFQKLPLRAVAASRQALGFEHVRQTGTQPAECPEGVGQETFRLVLRCLPAREYVLAGTEES
jgi:hypothetical protein